MTIPVSCSTKSEADDPSSVRIAPLSSHRSWLFMYFAAPDNSATLAHAACRFSSLGQGKGMGFGLFEWSLNWMTRFGSASGASMPSRAVHILYWKRCEFVQASRGCFHLVAPSGCFEPDFELNKQPVKVCRHHHDVLQIMYAIAGRDFVAEVFKPERAQGLDNRRGTFPSLSGVNRIPRKRVTTRTLVLDLLLCRAVDCGNM